MTPLEVSQLPLGSSSESSSSIEGEDYEISTAGSKKRIPKEQLQRTSKRLKPLQSKLALLKLRTRVRVWWTELEDSQPQWFVGTVRKLCSSTEFKIVYDHEIKVSVVNQGHHFRKQYLKKTK